MIDDREIDIMIYMNIYRFHNKKYNKLIIIKVLLSDLKFRMLSFICSAPRCIKTM